MFSFCCWILWSFISCLLLLSSFMDLISLLVAKPTLQSDKKSPSRTVSLATLTGLRTSWELYMVLPFFQSSLLHLKSKLLFLESLYSSSTRNTRALEHSALPWGNDNLYFWLSYLFPMFFFFQEFINLCQQSMQWGFHFYVPTYLRCT